MSAFGFAPLPPTPAPDPRQVGQALAAQRIAAPAVSQRLTPSNIAGPAPEPSVGDPLEHSLRLLGAQHSGGVGQLGTGSAPAQMPDYVHEPMEDSRTTSALAEALTRLGGGPMPNPHRTAEQLSARRQQLLRLGLSPFEVELLTRSQGA